MEKDKKTRRTRGRTRQMASQRTSQDKTEDNIWAGIEYRTRVENDLYLPSGGPRPAAICTAMVHDVELE
jgi:hypothetical protein